MTDDIKDGYWIPHRITKDGKVVSIKRYSYGHCGVYEDGNMLSDLVFETGFSTLVLRLRNYDDLPRPDYILKLKQ